MKFRQNTMTNRELRRMAERNVRKEQRQKSVAAFWALPPEERAQLMRDNEAFQRISRNGITLEDMHRAETEAYAKGIQEGKDATVRTCFAAICLTLHDMHGFGKNRCAKVLNDVYDRLCYALNSQEAIDEVYSTMGLEITFSGDATEDVVQGVSACR